MPCVAVVAAGLFATAPASGQTSRTVAIGESAATAMPAATTEASEPPITRVGTQPIYEALDSATGTLYVANSGGNTVTVVPPHG